MIIPRLITCIFTIYIDNGTSYLPWRLVSKFQYTTFTNSITMLARWPTFSIKLMQMMFCCDALLVLLSTEYISTTNFEEGRVCVNDLMHRGIHNQRSYRDDGYLVNETGTMSISSTFCMCSNVLRRFGYREVSGNLAILNSCKMYYIFRSQKIGNVSDEHSSIVKAPSTKCNQSPQLLNARP